MANKDELDLLSRYAYAVSEVMQNVGCSTLNPEWTLTVSCGMCAACRVRNLQHQVETIADGDGTHVVAALT